MLGLLTVALLAAVQNRNVHFEMALHCCLLEFLPLRHAATSHLLHFKGLA